MVPPRVILRKYAGIADWLLHSKTRHEIEFKPARMMIPDSSGFPLFGDMAAMRDAMKHLGTGPVESIRRCR